MMNAVMISMLPVADGITLASMKTLIKKVVAHHPDSCDDRHRWQSLDDALTVGFPYSQYVYRR